MKEAIFRHKLYRLKKGMRWKIERSNTVQSHLLKVYKQAKESMIQFSEEMSKVTWREK